MILIVGLGPIGGNVGLHLAELGTEVVGLDLAANVAEAWSRESGRTSWTDYDAVRWDEIDSVILAVRMADQVEASAAEIARHAGDRPLSVYVATTLSVSAAETLLPLPVASWRVFECPVSGGPNGSRTGTLTIFLAGPDRTDKEQALLSAITSNIFEYERYGEPARVKLLNNALGALNAVATAEMLLVCERLGLDPTKLEEVLRVSSGQSWMSDNFRDFHYEMLCKDVRLLIEDVPDLPVVSLGTTEGLPAIFEDARVALEGRKRTTTLEPSA